MQFLVNILIYCIYSRENGVKDAQFSSQQRLLNTWMARWKAATNDTEWQRQNDAQEAGTLPKMISMSTGIETIKKNRILFIHKTNIESEDDCFEI